MFIFSGGLFAALVLGVGAAQAKLPCGATNAVGKSWTVYVNGVSCTIGRTTVRRLTALPAARTFLNAHKRGKVRASYRYPSPYLGMMCSLSYLPGATTKVVAKLVILCLDLHTGKAVGTEKRSRRRGYALAG